MRAKFTRTIPARGGQTKPGSRRGVRGSTRSYPSRTFKSQPIGETANNRGSAPGKIKRLRVQ